MPSEKYSSSFSRLMFTNGSTATEAVLDAFACSGRAGAVRRARKCQLTPGAAARRPTPTRTNVSLTPARPACLSGRGGTVLSMPPGDTSNAQARRITMGKPAPSATTMKVSVHSGRWSACRTGSDICSTAKAAMPYAISARNTRLRLNSASRGTSNWPPYPYGAGTAYHFTPACAQVMLAPPSKTCDRRSRGERRAEADLERGQRPPILRDPRRAGKIPLALRPGGDRGAGARSRKLRARRRMWFRFHHAGAGEAPGALWTSLGRRRFRAVPGRRARRGTRQRAISLRRRADPLLRDAIRSLLLALRRDVLRRSAGGVRQPAARAASRWPLRRRDLGIAQAERMGRGAAPRARSPPAGGACPAHGGAGTLLALGPQGPRATARGGRIRATPCPGLEPA